MNMKSRVTRLIALSSCVIVATYGQSKQLANVHERLLAQVRNGASPAAVAAALAAKGANEHHRIAGIDVAVLQFPGNSASHVQGALERTGLFNFVEPDGLASAMLTPNDPDFSSQWHLNTIQATTAWGLTTGATSIPIAIIDSGIESTHPDLSLKVLAGWSFLTGTSNTSDTMGHGTAVSGTAAASTDNSLGVAGVAWGNPVMPLVVVDSTGSASYSNIASAITYAADHGARVINISIAGTMASSTLQSAVDYAWNKGVVIVAAAGNSSSSSPNYPAACNNVIAVSATTSSDALSSYSNYGSWIDLSAPGDSILTTMTGGGYGAWQGTSFASPVVAGVAALVLAERPALSNSALVSLLEQNSDQVGGAGYSQYFGWGRINAYRAVSAAQSLGSSGDTIPPTVSISSPATGAAVSGTIQVQGTATDNVGVTNIQFYVDGQLVASTTTSPFSFSWNTTTSANASHTLTVKAYDAASNVGTASVSVNVNNQSVTDTLPPVVSITSPQNGTVVSGSVKINVSATDNVGVAQVSIYIDNVQVYKGTVAPYTYAWNTKKVSRGTHVITAKAWDAAGNMGAATPVSVTK
jgi:subtilisin family serine protease